MPRNHHRVPRLSLVGIRAWILIEYFPPRLGMKYLPVQVKKILTSLQDSPQGAGGQGGLDTCQIREFVGKIR